MCEYKTMTHCTGRLPYIIDHSGSGGTPFLELVILVAVAIAGRVVSPGARIFKRENIVAPKLTGCNCATPIYRSARPRLRALLLCSQDRSRARAALQSHGQSLFVVPKLHRSTPLL